MAGLFGPILPQASAAAHPVIGPFSDPSDRPSRLDNVCVCSTCPSSHLRFRSVGEVDHFQSTSSLPSDPVWHSRTRSVQPVQAVQAHSRPGLPLKKGEGKEYRGESKGFAWTAWTGWTPVVAGIDPRRRGGQGDSQRLAMPVPRGWSLPTRCVLPAVHPPSAGEPETLYWPE